jgi:hypothetical protein
MRYLSTVKSATLRMTPPLRGRYEGLADDAELSRPKFRADITEPRRLHPSRAYRRNLGNPRFVRQPAGGLCDRLSVGFGHVMPWRPLQPASSEYTLAASRRPLLHPPKTPPRLGRRSLGRARNCHRAAAGKEPVTRLKYAARSISYR